MTKPKRPPIRKAERETRLAEALRRNLARRKAQTRKRVPAAEPRPERTGEDRPKPPKSA